MNPHWEGVNVNFAFERKYINYLKEFVGNNKIILTLIGIRRVGKSVLMKQTLQHIIDKGTERKRILFFSFDSFREDPFAVIKTWSQELTLDLRNGNYFVFFDEIQYVDKWAEKLKIIYDNFPNFYMVLSGSSTAMLKRGKESLAGREVTLHIEPLSFKEFLVVKKIEPVSETMAWNYFLEYLNQQLPAIASEGLDPFEYIKELVEKVIDQDIPKLFNVEETDSIKTIFRIICKDPGQIIRITDLAKDLELNRATVSKYLTALEESMLIRKVYNFSRNARKSEKADKKYYPHFSSLHIFTKPFMPSLAKIAETETASKLSAEYFWNEKGKEIDFVIGKELEIGVEVKIRNTVDNSDLKWLLNSKIPLKRKIVVVMPESKIHTSSTIEAVPLHKLEAIKQEETKEAINS